MKAEPTKSNVLFKTLAMTAYPLLCSDFIFSGKALTLAYLRAERGDSDTGNHDFNWRG
jgi:hypothetical protein